MNASEHERGIVLPFHPRAIRRAAQRHVLAIVGGMLDDAVIDLALVLAQEAHSQIDLLLLAEAPLSLPRRAYGDLLVASGGDTALDVAEQRCGAALAESGILLCHSVGPALLAEAHERESSDLVIGAPSGGWWDRWRMQRAIAHVRQWAQCRVYVVHVPQSPGQQESPRRVAR